LSVTTLYGTTDSGGTNGNGTVFKVNTDGSGYVVLHYFTGNGDGARTSAGLVLSGTTLYGTTPGDESGYGTIFKINTDGSSFCVLKELKDKRVPMGEIYYQPPAGLLLSGTTLYGTTQGDDSDYGTVFKINTDGSGYTVIEDFTNSTDGSCLNGGLILSGSTLYGTTYNGGTYDSGVVFALGYPPTMQTPPQTQTTEVGSTVNFRPDIAGDPGMIYKWFFSGTNVVIDSTNSCLELTNVQFSQSGAYTVVVSNIFGAVTSSPAMLNVVAAVERRPVPGVKVMGEAGSLLNVDYANSLSPAPNWTALGSVSLTSTSQFCPDLTVPLPPQRFYRAWQSGTPGVVPSLNLNFVPAITLTGNINDSLRLDYINAIGPTDAWVTLDTVTLTNTSQLYFDVSAPGQPQRLYQIMPIP
jgi:uncharacterized repeat protein (TIGR03803 family)